MLTYYRDHEDPEMRAKYENWQAANTRYLNKQGILTAGQKAEAQEGMNDKEKEDLKKSKAKSTLMTMLLRLAGSASYKSHQKSTAKKTNIRKSGGQRGS